MNFEKKQSASYHFTAFLDNVKTLYSVLKAINFQESAIFCASEEGLKVTVEQSKCIQASAYIPSANFWEYSVSSSEAVEFKINLTVLTECLNIFGSEDESSVKLFYKQRGSPLIIMLESKSKSTTGVDNLITDCEIRTQEVDELMYFKGDDDVSEVATLVVKGPQFTSVLNDIEKSSEVVELSLDPDHHNINIKTLGPQDTASVDIPRSSDMIHVFSCTQLVTLKYKYSHIRLTVKALALATKVALKFDSRGLLLMQHMIERDEEHQMFIEFYITPLLDDEE